MNNGITITETPTVDLLTKITPFKDRKDVVKGIVASFDRKNLRISANNDHEGYEREAKNALFLDLREAIVLMGLSKISSKEELKAILVPVVNEIYETHTYIVPANKEISEAVKLVSRGKIHYEINLFGNMPNLVFFNGLLGEYKKYVLQAEAKAYKEYTDWQESQKAEEYLKGANDRIKQSMLGMFKILSEKEYEPVSINDLPQYFRYGIGYDIAEASGWIIFQKEEKISAMEEAAKLIAAQDLRNEATSPFQKLTGSLMPESYKQNRLKNMAKDVLYTKFINEAWQYNALKDMK